MEVNVNAGNNVKAARGIVAGAAAPGRSTKTPYALREIAPIAANLEKYASGDYDKAIIEATYEEDKELKAEIDAWISSIGVMSGGARGKRYAQHGGNRDVIIAAIKSVASGMLGKARAAGTVVASAFRGTRTRAALSTRVNTAIANVVTASGKADSDLSRVVANADLMTIVSTLAALSTVASFYGMGPSWDAIIRNTLLLVLKLLPSPSNILNTLMTPALSWSTIKAAIDVGTVGVAGGIFYFASKLFMSAARKSKVVVAWGYNVLGERTGRIATALRTLGAENLDALKTYIETYCESVTQRLEAAIRSAAPSAAATTAATAAEADAAAAAAAVASAAAATAEVDAEVNAEVNANVPAAAAITDEIAEEVAQNIGEIAESIDSEDNAAAIEASDALMSVAAAAAAPDAAAGAAAGAADAVNEEESMGLTVGGYRRATHRRHTKKHRVHRRKSYRRRQH